MMVAEVIRMYFLLFSLAVALAFFAGSILLLEYGRRLGQRRLSEEGGTTAMVGLNAVEGAVFALMGLLLAFTMSGALQRFDERRQLVLQEANAIGTAYDRMGLLVEQARVDLRGKLKAYLGERLQLYKVSIDFSVVNGASVYSADQLAKIAVRRREVWDGAIAACSREPIAVPCNLILPALNEAFEAARLRAGANERHPPQILYVMLFGLGLGGSLLAGFGMGAATRRSPVHMVIFAGAISIALYVITDIEFPRQGLISVAYFDTFLEQLHSSMK